ncbi:methyl-accepting chemotaxis protein [Desulfonatronum parangueonense]
MTFHLSYRIKLGLAIFIPIAFFVIQSWQSVFSTLKNREILLEMHSNISFLGSASALVREVQTERGVSVLALAGGADRGDVLAQRSQTDTAVARFQELAREAGIASDAPRAAERIIAELRSARRGFDASQESGQIIESYTSIIRDALQLAGETAEARTARGLGKRMTSLMLVEEARENAGLLRAALGRSVTAPEDVDQDMRTLVARLVYSVEANMQSPALALAREAAVGLDDARDGESWMEITTMAAALIDGEQEFAMTHRQTYDLATRHIEALGRVIDLEQEAIMRQATRFVDQSSRDFTTTLALLALAVLASVALGLFVLRAISMSLRRMSAICGDMAAGDLSKTMDVQGTDDIARTAMELNRLIASLREKQRIAERIAEGDFTSEVAVLSERDALGLAMEKMVRQMSESLAAVHEAAQQVGAGSTQIAAASQSLSEGATESAASLEQITSSMAEIDSQATLTAENAQQANQLATSARDSAAKGSSRMSDMVSAMAEINASSQQIAKIIKTIDDIAFQTNLLALNAAVEAARAGSHGKGFAVVAEEVRNLAARSARAARETAELIEASRNKVDNGAVLANLTAEVLNEIVQGVTKAADIVGEIAAASKEQSFGVSQINQGLEQIDIVTQQNSAHAEQTASSAQQLSAQALELQDMLAHFRLGDHVALPASRAIRPPALPQSRGGSAFDARSRDMATRRSLQSGHSGMIDPGVEIKLDDEEFGKF